MRSSREGAASTQRLCVSQTHLAVEVARSRSRPPRVGRAAASCRLGPARHAGCQVHIAPHAEHTVGPQQGRLGLCPQEQRGTRHTGREHQRSWSLPGIQLQNVLPGESTSAAGLFPRYTGREHQRSWSLPVIAAAEPRGGAGPVGAAGADLVGAAAAGLRGGAAGAGLRGGAASSTERLRGGAAGWPPRRRSGCWPPRRRSGCWPPRGRSGSAASSVHHRPSASSVHHRPSRAASAVHHRPSASSVHHRQNQSCLGGAPSAISLVGAPSAEPRTDRTKRASPAAFP